MNREIKFRVWDKRTNRWFSMANALCLLLNPDSTDLVFITAQGPFKLPDTDQPDGGMNRFVIQQYTGLIDKYNNPIYEGDILSWSEYQGWEDGRTFIGRYEVRWSEDKLMFIFRDVYDDTEWDAADTQFDEVIGNIFENPELLKNNL